ncbi:MAG: DUF3460 family protein [Alcaligenaceae bacterium]|nr:DUF3460 family protein [Alcaligenaceae bacterium]
MMGSYVSEVTQFIKQYKKDHPETEQRQREGRHRLWDKKIDLEMQEQYKAARVPQKPYVYHNK